MNIPESASNTHRETVSYEGCAPEPPSTGLRSAPSPLQRGVTPMAIRRIPASRRSDLVPRHVGQIDVQHVCQPDEIDQHVRQFLADSPTKRLRGGTSYRLIGRQPLEQLGQLPQLAQ